MALRLFFFLSFLCLSVLGTSFSSALAQDGAPQTSEQQDENDGNINFDEIPEKYLFESRSVYKECRGTHTMRINYDCKCYAMRFLETRMERGPVDSTTSIKFAIRKECRDATESAGYEYNQCLRDYGSFEPGTDPEKYCECYANKYVELLEFHTPTLQSSKLVPLKVAARVECSGKH